MAWIKSYQEIERHPKTIVLMKEMGWPLDVAISKLHRLWWWCADYAYDGDISKHDPDTIATAIGCADMKGEFLIAALIKAGFVDKEPKLRLHDWYEHFGDFLRAKFSRAPKIWQDIQMQYTNIPPTVQQLDGCRPLNKGNKGEEIKRGKKEKGSVAFAPPTIEQVKAYCQERGNAVNPDKWLSHYEANGWLVGKNRMKDWRAAVRTWEHSQYAQEGVLAAPVRHYKHAPFEPNAEFDASGHLIIKD